MLLINEFTVTRSVKSVCTVTRSVKSVCTVTRFVKSVCIRGSVCAHAVDSEAQSVVRQH